MRQVLIQPVEALFRVLFTYDCLGEEKLPASGPALVAANHPSYLDPILLSLQVRRPIRFMASHVLFKVPLLGRVIRAFGAFPVNVRPGMGREAYEKAKALLEAGEIVGIFPEGKRSLTAWMEPKLREGTARLALETGAPLFPATIAGAFRAWPHFQSLPKPARIRVRFHDPIDPGPYRSEPEQEALPAMLAELRRRVDRSLLPGVKRDLRINILYRQRAPWPGAYEWGPALALALLVFSKTRSLLSVVPVYAYLLYLMLDHFLLPQSRLMKWVRNGSAALFLLGYGPSVLRYLGLPRVPAPDALLALLLGAFFPYLYERAHKALGFVRGFVAAWSLELLALLVAPTGLGPHMALPLFAAAYAWERRTVFWRYAAPILGAYALLIPPWLGGGLELGFHGLAGLLAWLLVQLFPYRQAVTRAEEPAPQGLGLRL